MPAITEKGIHLDFPAQWAVVKYDGDATSSSANFYRAFIANQVQHVRGVDVVVHVPAPAERLLLIEVKDYRISATPVANKLGELRQAIIQKALNTLSGLYVAARVGNPELQAVTVGMFRPQLRIEVVFVLEQPPLPENPVTVAQKFRRQNPRTARVDMELELLSRLSALGMGFKLHSSSSLSSADGWAIRL